MAPPLERVARQRDPAAGLVSEQPLERHRQAGLVGGRHRVQEAAAVGRLRPSRRGPLQARHRDRLAAAGRLGPGHQRHWRQHLARPDLDDGVDARLRQRLHALAEPHRLPGLAPPVGPVERLLRPQRPAQHGTHHRDLRQRHVNVGEDRLQVVEGRFHHRAVVALAGAQPSDLDLLRLEGVQQGLHLVGRAAEHLMQAVVGRDGQPGALVVGAELLDGLRHPLPGREDRPHGALLGKLRHEPAPGRGEPQTVLQAEDARRLGGGYLAEAVAHHHVGTDADARPKGGQRALHGVDARLSPARIVELAARVGLAEHD